MSAFITLYFVLITVQGQRIIITVLRTSGVI